MCYISYMKTVLIIVIANLLLFTASQPVSAQVICSSAEGEFGPTCAATIVPPTNTPIPPTNPTNPTLPPANTPIPELPRSGNTTTPALLIFGGGVIFLLGLGSLKSFKTGF